MSGSTSSFLLYHLIFSTKKRARTIHPKLRQALFAYMGGIIKKIGGTPVLINGVWDHVHILAFLPRHISLSQSVQAIKGGSAYWFNRQDEKPRPQTELAGRLSNLYGERIPTGTDQKLHLQPGGASPRAEL